jgi:hypothetical protein
MASFSNGHEVPLPSEVPLGQLAFDTLAARQEGRVHLMERMERGNTSLLFPSPTSNQTVAGLEEEAFGFEEEDEEDELDCMNSLALGSTSLPPAKTTLMIRNIPLTYTQDMLLQEWPNHGTYDFLYMPSITYAFVNFTSESAALNFMQQWKQLRLRHGRAKKPLNISFALVQGFAENVRRWKRKRTWRLSNRARPLVFEDGVQVTLDSTSRLQSAPIAQSAPSESRNDGNRPNISSISGRQGFGNGQQALRIAMEAGLDIPPWSQFPTSHQQFPF